MTSPAEGANGVMSLGFSEPQARFLATVMVHGGVCLLRQYCAFRGIARGQKAHDFFSDLVQRGFVTRFAPRPDVAHLYHVRSKVLYRAIAEEDNRNRKPLGIAQAIERAMMLDAVLQHLAEYEWLATERDKVRHFEATCGVERAELPHLTFGTPPDTTVRYFPDKQPIGIDRARGEVVVFYLVTKSTPIDFRLFLFRHAELLRRLRRWAIRLVVPRHVRGSGERHRVAVFEELGTPLRPDTRDELLWFFRRRLDGGLSAGEGDDRYRRAQRLFRAPRFAALYRAWTAYGDGAVHATTSPVLRDALSAGDGRCDIYVLPNGYPHLAPLLGTA